MKTQSLKTIMSLINQIIDILEKEVQEVDTHNIKIPHKGDANLNPISNIQKHPLPHFLKPHKEDKNDK